MIDNNIRASIARTGDVSPTIRERLTHLPELPPAAWAYWNAFFELNEHRGTVLGFSMALEPRLTYMDVSAYAKDNGFGDPDAMSVFFQMIRAMDAVWVKFHNKQKEAEVTPPIGG